MATLLYFFDNYETEYLGNLKPLLSGHKVHLSNQIPVTVAEMVISAKNKQAAGVIVSQVATLRKLLEKDPDTSAANAAKATLDDYAGSIITLQDTEFLIVNPCDHLVKVPEAHHLFKRYFRKLTAKDSWFPHPAFSWTLVDIGECEAAYQWLSECQYISIDIETYQQGLVFDCICFTGIKIGKQRIEMHTFEFVNDGDFLFAYIKKICEETKGEKIFQNGKYDNAYLSRFGICCYNWLWDTAHLFHCWYAELPKRLDFIVSYTLRTGKFWKDDHKGGDAYDRYRYNARDGWNTACAFLSLLSEMPKWALDNYKMEFPLVFPCHLAEMQGLKIDPPAFDKMKAELQKRVDNKIAQFQVEVNTPNFNSNSPKQVKQLMDALGSKDLKGSDKVSMDQFANRHPINELIAERIKDIRADNKVISSYLKDGIYFTDNIKIVKFPRVLYSLNPHGTDTGRLASKEHHFWCGLQIQNIKRDDDDFAEDIGNVKDIIIADEDFWLAEADFEQAEARDTGYLSGDTALIAAVDGVDDFHARNASAFFGVLYEQIYNNEKKKTLNKPLRDLAKRTNHGANYNMRANMLLMTMGIKKVIAAKKSLGLPPSWSLKQVCQFLLDRFDATYTIVRGAYQDNIKYRVKQHHMLQGPTGWTRYCFGNPEKSRPALNSYVAHCSQSLNAMTLNEAWMRIFYQVYLPNIGNFKLHAQIHDSILFSYRTGYEHLALKVVELMAIPTPVTDMFGNERILTVPAALKWRGKRWSELEEYLPA